MAIVKHSNYCIKDLVKVCKGKVISKTQALHVQTLSQHNGVVTESEHAESEEISLLLSLVLHKGRGLVLDASSVLLDPCQQFNRARMPLDALEAILFSSPEKNLVFIHTASKDTSR
jgi:hypothetical protein